MEEPMEISKNLVENSKVREEMEDSMEVTIEKTQGEVEAQRDNGNEEEIIMIRLLQDWKNLDERFIPENQKQLYKETF